MNTLKNIVLLGAGYLAGRMSRKTGAGIGASKFYEWRVSASINGKRIITETGLFQTKQDAQKFAKETNKTRRGANARVIKVLTP